MSQFSPHEQLRIRHKHSNGAVQCGELTRIHTMASQFIAVLLLGFLSPVLSTSTDACFTDIHLTGAMINITSPGFPSSYGPNISCSWRIHASSPEYLVGINYFQSLDYTYLCDRDILSFYDGPDNSSDLLLELCDSRASLGSILSDGPTMYIQFTTGAATNGLFFLLNVTDVERCDGNLTATSEEGNFTSLSLIHTTFANQKCTWIITTENENDTVKVTIKGNDTVNVTNKDQLWHLSTRCKHDMVRVYDGNTTEAAQFIGELCSTVNTTYYSSGNTLSVVFEKLTSKGVQLQYTATTESDCNRTYYISGPYNNPVYIQSPGYPDSYDSDLECVIVIIDLGYIPNLKLHVVNADIEGDYPQCDNDSVTVFGGDQGTYHHIGEFCGNSSVSPVGPYYSNGRTMKLVFKSDSHTSGAGFQAIVSHSYREVVPYQSRNCGPRYITATTNPESINSPGYPVLSPSNADCIWVIKASDPKMMVRIDVLDSNIRSQYFLYQMFCDRSRVTVHDGPSIFNTTLLSWCGRSRPILQSSGPTITVQYHAQDVNNVNGFKFKYFATNETGTCGGTVNITTDKETNLTVPYGPYRDCIWTIHAPSTTNIQVTTNAVSWYTSSSCSANYLQIYDGNYDNSTSTTHGKWCDYVNADFISSGNVMTVRFYSSAINRGLQMNLKAGHFSASLKKSLSASYLTGYITSPNYPFDYPSNVESTWKIDAGSGYHVYIDVVVSRLEYSDGCQNDFMEAFDGGDANALSLGRWCGSSVPTKTSSSSLMFLKFKSNSHKVDKGFKISYSAEMDPIDFSTPTSNVRVRAIVGASIGSVSLLFTIIGAICRLCARSSADSRQPAASSNTGQRPMDAIIPPATYSSPSTFKMEHTSTTF
ncbi:cubilin-like [Haliotis asinina]|uniref:cubilin-like n=1 Tax=Haliotis asinina TaxID=109174 RepID=UPI0035326301